MDRLTEWAAPGIAVPAYPTEAYLEEKVLNDFDQAVITRLAAYEDTGLKPEECLHGKVIANDELLDALQAYQELGPIDHLRELVEAEKEGRLVKLPCKEDDEVYVLLIGRVIPFEVTSVNLDGRGAPLFRAMHGLRLMYAFRPEDIDKTVFLTREEANAALKEE